jgi:hypothetical protein
MITIKREIKIPTRTKKIIVWSQKKIRKKKIFPGIVQKKNSLLGR